MNQLHSAEWHAEDFMKQLKLGAEMEQRCEWSCLLWLKDHWAEQAKKTKIAVQQSKERLNNSPGKDRSLEELSSDSEFLNTVARAYSELFGGVEESCSVKRYSNCPFAGQRQDFLRRGALANAFATILQKAASYVMLDRHPLDSGLIHEEYDDVYGVDLTSFKDLDLSLKDGRFDELYTRTLGRAEQLAGITQKPSICPASDTLIEDGSRT